MQTNNTQYTFDFTVFWHNFRLAFRKLFWIPLVLALLAGAFGYYRRVSGYVPVYEGKAVYIVSSNYAEATDISAYSYITDSNAASKLTATFPYVLETDTAKQLIYQRLGVFKLPAKVTGSSLAESNIFTITVQGSSSEAVWKTLETVVDIYPQAAANILGNITLEPLENPEVSDQPTNVLNPTRTVIKYALFGLAVGLALIALTAYLRKTVHSSEELQNLVSTPCLGVLPKVRFKARTDANRNVVLTNEHIDPSYSEAVHTLRFKLKRELERQSAQVLMVTSTNANEGKTTVAANLALALAEAGNRVLLLDADLRKQSQKALFGVTEASKGLPDLIAEHAETLSPLSVPNSELLLLSGDKNADQPQRFLASARMKKILASLREQMDYIIIDTPPCGFLSDAATLSPLVDGVIYVVRQDYVSRSTIATSMQLLASTDVRFVGCVLNNAERGTSRYGYGYKYGYGSKYGGYYGYGSKYYGKKGEEAPEEPTEEFVK